jgi:hypothetical protein
MVHKLFPTSACVAGLALVVTATDACDSRPVKPIDADDGGADTAAETETPPPPPVELGRHTVTVTETRRVVPSPGLPPEAPALNSNNNLDVVRFDGRVWLAWRTAPDHYASDRTIMAVASSADEITWKLEKTFTTGIDLREPRFLVVNGALFLYLAQLGKDPVKFEPKGVWFSKRAADGTFSDLSPVLRTSSDAGADAGPDAGASAPQPMTGYIAWRTKTERGKPYMTAYLGGEHIYRFDGLPLDVELLTTDDGVTWRGVDPDKPVVSRGGGSETDFAIGDDGTLFGIIRNEAGDATGYGSKVCRAPAGDLATWTCKSDPKKYDSPLMFWHDGEAYLFGRRNLSKAGNYDLGARDPNVQQNVLAFQLDYRTRKKRCGIWRYVQGEDRIAYIGDLPSRGDTCFASKLDSPASPQELVIYDYSSDVDGPDVSWGEGQAGPTYVYRHVVRFTPR